MQSLRENLLDNEVIFVEPLLAGIVADQADPGSLDQSGRIKRSKGESDRVVRISIKVLLERDAHNFLVLWHLCDLLDGVLVDCKPMPR